jgi:hypothetical protein
MKPRVTSPAGAERFNPHDNSRIIEVSDRESGAFMLIEFRRWRLSPEDPWTLLVLPYSMSGPINFKVPEANVTVTEKAAAKDWEG